MLQKLGKIVHCNNFTCNERFFFMFHYKLLGFFVTFQEFSAFLCIKAVWRIEEKLGYELATVLNSMCCYKLPKRAPDSEPPPVSWLVVRYKGTTLF